MTASPRGWSRKYLPLLTVMVALALTIFALPSALNLPQANPGQTLEYAPVPGNAGQAGQGGNLAGLGLGSGSSGVGSAGLGGLDGVLGAPPLLGTGGHPSNYQCVGNPPRQTEDPLSPPCVPFFNGDNGGATYTGVSGTEIRILYYFYGTGGSITSSRGLEQQPGNTYVDLWDPPQANEHIFVRALRMWQTYFANRYQTYGRRPHFFVYFANGAETVDQRRADAADNFARIHPAVVFDSATGNEQAYEDAMAQKGVMSFGDINLRNADLFTSYPKLIWGFLPSIDSAATTFASLVCTKAKPNPVSFSGNPGEDGSQRVYALYKSNDPVYPNFQHLGDVVQSKLQACGMTMKDTITIPTIGCVAPNQDNATHAAQLRADHVTTVIWAAGSDECESQAEGAIGYTPEWIVAGDNVWMDTNANSSSQSQAVWKNAWVITPSPVYGKDAVEVDCEEAVHSVDSSITGLDLLDYCNTYVVYDDMRHFFTGVQVAGPRFNPTNLDKGFRAIPPHSSNVPGSPACYYDPGDYTCVKDMIVEWYDPSTVVSNGVTTNQGALRMIDKGLRFRVGYWPPGNVDAGQDKQSDPPNYR